MKPKWKPHDDPQCACSGCASVTSPQFATPGAGIFTVSRSRFYRLVRFEFDDAMGIHDPGDEDRTP